MMKSKSCFEKSSLGGEMKRLLSIYFDDLLTYKELLQKVLMKWLKCLQDKPKFHYQNEKLENNADLKFYLVIYLSYLG